MPVKVKGFYYTHGKSTFTKAQRRRRKKLRVDLLRQKPSLRLKRFARYHREQRNWGEVQIKKLFKKFGIKFRYQKPMQYYIPDFYLPAYFTIIEVDGSSHKGRWYQDLRRDQWFEEHGITTVRIRIKDISDIQKLSKKAFLSRLTATARSRVFPTKPKRKVR